MKPDILREFGLDGDEKQINTEALKEACEAKVLDEHWSKVLRDTPRPSETRNRYLALVVSARMRMHDKAQQAVPELGLQGKLLDQLASETADIPREIIEGRKTEEDLTASSKKLREKSKDYWDKFEKTLDRLCNKLTS